MIFTEDANGCTDSLNVTINQPDEVNFYTSVFDVSCFAGNDGSLSIDSVTGGHLHLTIFGIMVQQPHQ